MQISPTNWAMIDAESIVAEEMLFKWLYLAHPYPLTAPGM